MIAPTAADESEIQGVARFMGDASYEATRPRDADLREAAARLAPGSRLYLTALRTAPDEETIAAALLARRLGLEPVPHLATRRYASLADVARFASTLVKTCEARTIMLIGGDMPPRSEETADALRVLEAGVLQDAGVRAVGLAGFPDGHPQLSADELELSLVTKVAAAQRAGLDAHIVTQFCFEVAPIVAWLQWLRKRGVQVPVRVGFAGPTSLMSWMKFARACGVKASAEALASQSGLARHAFRAVAPDALVRGTANAVADGRLGEVAAHFFAFGGAGATARWAAAPATGRIRLKPDGGFESLAGGSA